MRAARHVQSFFGHLVEFACTCRAGDVVIAVLGCCVLRRLGSVFHRPFGAFFVAHRTRSAPGRGGFFIGSPLNAIKRTRKARRLHAGVSSPCRQAPSTIHGRARARQVPSRAHADLIATAQAATAQVQRLADHLRAITNRLARGDMDVEPALNRILVGLQYAASFAEAPQTVN